MNVENRENNLISFELTDEDVQAIRGGSTKDASGFRNEDTASGAYHWHFRFPITCVVTIGRGGKTYGGPLQPVNPVFLTN